MNTAHPLEWTFLGLAAVAMLVSAYLFALKVGDMLAVKRSGKNGPMLFAAVDNLRRQGFTLAVCGGMLMLAVSSVNSTLELNPQTMNLLTGGVFFASAVILEAVFIYRRREKMALLVALYDGGVPRRRATDHPAH